MGTFCNIVDDGVADYFGYVFTPCQPEPEPVVAMVKVSAGTFEMGSISDGNDGHKVTITHDYYLDETEVTNEAYKSIMGEGPSPKGFDGPNQPVVRVPWNKADKYCKAIGKRLPTEAEWENAASVGGKYLFGTKSGAREKLAEEVCFDKDKTCDVKEYPPSENGLYGMSGNVWEWVSDWYDKYSTDHVVDPKGPNDGYYRILRGGSWGSSFSGDLRAALRLSLNPDVSSYYFGFRCALSEDSSK